MTINHERKYWRECSIARKALEKRGQVYNTKEWNQERHNIHFKALGIHKSHKLFNNEEFDKVLAQLWVISLPANLNAQLRQLDQPTTRFCFKAISIIKQLNHVDPKHAFSYFEGLCAKVGKGPFDQLDPKGKRAVIAALNKQLFRTKKPQQKQPDSEKIEIPF